MGIVPGRGTRDNPTPLDVRFWSKVDKRGQDECWPWIGSSGKDGYGKIWDGSFLTSGGRRIIGAHRAALIVAGVQITPKQCALHRCNNKWCVNPSHLYPGSHSQNAYDAMRVGALCLAPVAKGEGHYRAVLSERDVHDIRRRYAKGGVTQQKLADEYGITNGLICMVINRKRWAHVR